VYHHNPFGGGEAIYAIQNDNSLWAVGSGRLIGDGTGVDRNDFVKIAEDVAFVIIPGPQETQPGVLGFIRTDKTLWLLEVEPIQVADNIVRPLNGRYFLRSDGSVIELSHNNEIIETGITNVVDAYFAGRPGMDSAGTHMWYTLSVDGVLSRIEAIQDIVEEIPNEIVAHEIISNNVSSMLVTGEFRRSPHLLGEDINNVSVHFLRNDGTLWGIGANSHGQLGDGTKIDREEPVQVADDVLSFNILLARTDINPGGRRGFIRNDGTPWAWTHNEPTPIQVSASPFASVLFSGDSNRAISLFGITQDGRFASATDGTLVSAIDPRHSEEWIENIMLPSTIVFE